MNNKGFAVSSIIYSLLILFIILIFGILSILGSRKLILDKLKYQVMDELNGDNLYKDDSGANQPELFNNMIPVSYNGINWVYANTTKKWYNYNSKEWANAVVLNSGITKKVGDIIDVATEVSQMYVWIPRYKYTIFNGNNGSAAAQEINVTFESGITSTGTVTCTDAVAGSGSSSETCTDTTNGSVTNGTSTYTHPAFTFGTVSLTGFWVGKFETGNVTSCTAGSTSGAGCDFTTLGIQIKPNVNSWRGARVSTFYTTIASISTTYGINADSHMMKNMEWGAVAYLEASKYGLSTTDIGINNNSNYTTGCGAASGSSSSSTCNTYNTSGAIASTTGNIYGVYDISGGAWEYVMGDMVTSGNVTMVGYDSTTNSGFTGTLYDGTSFSGTSLPDNKYYDIYTYDSLSSTTHSRGKLGDATKEVLVTYGSASGGWYNDHTAFSYSNRSWLARGGRYSNTSIAGMFYFNGTNGSADASYGSRGVITQAN